MDAIQLLKDDHKKVKELLTQLSETTDRAEKTRTELLEKIRLELEAHTTIEEEIFYPAFREAGRKSEVDKMYFEALEEHRAVEDLVMPDLQGTEPTSEKFSGRAKVLKELVEHHVEEEEKEMFPRAQKLLDKDELKQLGEQMQQRKKEILAQGGRVSGALQAQSRGSRGAERPTLQ